MYEEDLALNSLECLICIKPNPTKSFIFYVNMYKADLALNSLQKLICHKTQTN